jgi:hypothetical protein
MELSAGTNYGITPFIGKKPIAVVSALAGASGDAWNCLGALESGQLAECSQFLRGVLVGDGWCHQRTLELVWCTWSFCGEAAVWSLDRCRHILRCRECWLAAAHLLSLGSGFQIRALATAWPKLVQEDSDPIKFVLSLKTCLLPAGEKGEQWQQALSLLALMQQSGLVTEVASYSAANSACENDLLQLKRLGTCWQLGSGENHLCVLGPDNAAALCLHGLLQERQGAFLDGRLGKLCWLLGFQGKGWRLVHGATSGPGGSQSTIFILLWRLQARSNQVEMNSCHGSKEMPGALLAGALHVSGAWAYSNHPWTQLRVHCLARSVPVGSRCLPQISSGC